MSTDIHALSGAYAVDALDDLERAHFERHLGRCGSCRLEVDGLREAGSLIAATSSRPTTAALRNRVLADVAACRPLPPVMVRAKEVRRSSSRRFPRLVAAAAAFVVIGGAAATAWHPWAPTQQSAATSVQPSEWNDVLNSADVQHYPATLSGSGAQATLYRSKAQNLAVLAAKDLPTLPAGKVYAVWLLQGATRTPERAGLIKQSGTVKAVLSGDPARATGFAVSVENAGFTGDRPSDDRLTTTTFQS